jgi:hypothetical protein
MEKSPEHPVHKLSDIWTLWAHLPNDNNWSLKSYRKLITLESVEKVNALNEYLPDKFIKFVMRNNIKPMWEALENKEGGAFSYKVSNKNIGIVWKNLLCMLAGNSLTNEKIEPIVNGITISPKKNFCIIKIWLANCDNQNPEVINQIEGLSSYGCLFKKHNPEF